MAIDFFGVKLSGRIRQFPKGSGGKGRVVELWTKPQTTGLETELNALAFVSQITVEHMMGDNVKLAMVLTPPFEDGLALMQSELVRFGVGRLEVEFGYSTGSSTGGGATSFTQLPFSGFLQKPDVSIGNDITITLNAHGVGYQMNVIGGTESKTFPLGFTYAQAVETTLRKYVSEDGASTGLVIDNLYADIPDEWKDYENGDDFFREPFIDLYQTKPDADAPLGVITKGPRNDWWFVRETLETWGYDLIIHGNEIRIIGKTQYFNTQLGEDKKTRKHFLLRGRVDPTRNMFPILNFSSSQEGPWLSPGVGKLLMHDWKDDKGDKDPSSYASHAATVASGKGKEGDVGKVVEDGTESDKTDNGETVQAAANMVGSSGSAADRKKADSHWKDLQMRDGIQGDFTTIGIPGLRPGELVQVSGFEKMGSGADKERALFNGAYGIMVVRHQVGVGGWTTTFTGVIGGFGQDANLAKAKAHKTDVARQEEIAVDPKELAAVQKTAKDLLNGDKVKPGTRAARRAQRKATKQFLKDFGI